MELYQAPDEIGDKRILTLGDDVNAALTLLDRVLSASGHGFAYVDRHYRFVYANPWVANANGRTVEETLGRSVEEVVGTTYWEKLKPCIDEALRGVTVIDAIVTRESRRTPGAMRTGLLSYFPVESHGFIDSVIVVVKDVTEQVHAEQLLRQSELHSRKVAESAREQAQFERKQRFMAQLSEQMHAATSSEDVLWRVVTSLGKHLKVDRCAFGEIDRRTNRITVHRDYCHRVPSMAGTYRRIDFGDEVAAAMSTGRTVVIADARTDPRTAKKFETVFGPLKILASINVPIMQDGRQIATLAVQQAVPRQWTPEEASLVETVADGTWLSLENARLTRMTEQVEARQRVFVRDILASVTEGRLHLCQTDADLPVRLPVRVDWMPLNSDEDIAPARHAVQDIATDLGFAAFRVIDLVTATGEAAMNAVVHAVKGMGQVCAGDDTVQVWIEDHGDGIAVEDLPNVTLNRGYSTKQTLGHGFKIMLQTADRVYLLTGATGTTVVLEQDRNEPGPNW